MTPTEAQRLSEQARCGNTIHSDYVTDHRCQRERGHEGECAFGDSLARQLAEAKRAARLADKDASVAHDAMWAMDMATILAGPTRTAFEFHRKAASDAIWKIHERLRALNTDDCQQSSPKDSGESSTDGATTGVEGADGLDVPRNPDISWIRATPATEKDGGGDG